MDFEDIWVLEGTLRTQYGAALQSALAAAFPLAPAAEAEGEVVCSDTGTAGVMTESCCGYDGNQAPGCGAGIGRSTVELFGTSWVNSCDVAGRNVSTFYMGRRVLPWLDCCVSEFRPAHRPHEPAQAGDSDT